MSVSKKVGIDAQGVVTSQKAAERKRDFKVIREAVRRIEERRNRLPRMSDSTETIREMRYSRWKTE